MTSLFITYSREETWYGHSAQFSSVAPFPISDDVLTLCHKDVEPSGPLIPTQNFKQQSKKSTMFKKSLRS